MLRRSLVLTLLVPLLLGACGDDGPVTREQTVSGSSVIDKLEAAMRSAGTGRGRTHDGDTEYAWNFAGVGRMVVISHLRRLESRHIGEVVYQRAAGNPLWVKLPLKRAIEPLPELRYLKGRDVTEVTVDDVVVRYVVQVPANLVQGRNEDPGGGDELAVTIFVDKYGLPTRTQVEGNGLEGERFSDWGSKIIIEKPSNVYQGPRRP